MTPQNCWSKMNRVNDDVTKLSQYVVMSTDKIQQLMWKKQKGGGLMSAERVFAMIGLTVSLSFEY